MMPLLSLAPNAFPRLDKPTGKQATLVLVEQAAASFRVRQNVLHSRSDARQGRIGLDPKKNCHKPSKKEPCGGQIGYRADLRGAT
jgi:hypothetical protein